VAAPAVDLVAGLVASLPVFPWAAAPPLWLVAAYPAGVQLLESFGTCGDLPSRPRWIGRPSRSPSCSPSWMPAGQAACGLSRQAAPWSACPARPRSGGLGADHALGPSRGMLAGTWAGAVITVSSGRSGARPTMQWNAERWPEPATG
jgi:hypothetical protein